jgi:5-formyltetrahydrofolate cyclo-ligase
MDESCESRITRAQLRKQLLERRAAISGEARTGYDLAIGHGLQRVAAVEQAQVIGLYWPIRGEPDLRPLAALWRASGKSVALPVMQSRDEGLIFCAWRDDSELTVGPFGITVPSERVPLLPDCLVIPCLGFCVAEGRPWRLGYGAGYYDRTLSRRPVPSVGVAYEEGHTDQMAPEAWDAPLSVLVTPSRIIGSALPD